MNCDEAGIDFIKSFEGLKLSPYQDQKGIWTIGWGHTEGVTSKTPSITESQAQLILEEDIEEPEEAVTRMVRIQLTQNEFNALVSFTFNEGVTKFMKSTLLSMLNNGDKAGAGKQFDRWIYYEGEDGKMYTSPGLQMRREKEKELFLTDFLHSRGNVI